jgi:hypothetical protein
MLDFSIRGHDYPAPRLGGTYFLIVWKLFKKKKLFCVFFLRPMLMEPRLDGIGLYSESFVVPARLTLQCGGCYYSSV